MGSPRLRRCGRGRNAPPADPPRPRTSPQGPHLCHQSPPQTLPLCGPILHLFALGHLLEVRNKTFMCVPRRLHSFRATSPPKVCHEEPEEWDFDRFGVGLLLAFVFGDQSRGSGRGAEVSGPEAEAEGFELMGKFVENGKPRIGGEFFSCFWENEEHGKLEIMYLKNYSVN